MNHADELQTNYDETLRNHRSALYWIPGGNNRITEFLKGSIQKQKPLKMTEVGRQTRGSSCVGVC